MFNHVCDGPSARGYIVVVVVIIVYKAGVTHYFIQLWECSFSPATVITLESVVIDLRLAKTALYKTGSRR